MKAKGNMPAPGELRQSQLLSTFGPGSMVDLPDTSIIVGGLNHWLFGNQKRRISEERLEERVCKILEVGEIALYEPPASTQDPTAGRTGIRTFMFPAWFVAQIERQWSAPSGKDYRTRPLIPWNRLVGGKYLDESRRKRAVVPVRFVQACLNGHISDINWNAFVHNDFKTTCRGELWLDEGGTGNDFADIFVRCEACNARRPLSDAAIPNLAVLGVCEGHRPWLGPHAQEECRNRETGKRLPNRLLIRSASNAYFSQTLSVISLPNADEKVRDAVSLVYEDFLQYADDHNDITRERRKQRVSNALEGLSDDAVWAEVQRRKGGQEKQEKTIKQIEIETLLSQPNEVGEDIPEGDFYARNHPLDKLSSSLQERLDRIVLVHRLREVIAQVGFTRFEPALPDIDGELQLNVSLAALDLEPTWVPAIENRGEGIFLAFSKEAIASWLSRESVRERGKTLLKGFEDWLKRKGLSPSTFPFPGLPYTMLHSLSHLLITAVSLECGYSASAIRERIYTGESGYGILLYTGSSGSEGTLGGLVQEGKRLEHHLVNALELGKLCSNDPVCAQHKPDQAYEERFLHGAACHGCLLIAETCCERRNEFLDRALVVETVGGADAAFFPSDLV